MTILEALILGLLQGITEFLPVSSSGHLVLLQRIFGVAYYEAFTFTIVVHIATLIPVLFVYYNRVKSIVTKPFQKLTLLLILGTVPTVIAVVLFGDFIDTLFAGQGLFLAIGFTVTAIAMFLTDRSMEGTKDMDQITKKDALIIGVSQAFAIMPGISRSGSTIAGAVACKAKRDAAINFSFLLSIPAIAGGVALEIMHIISGRTTLDSLFTIPMLVGFLVAMISGYFAIKFMLKIVEKRKLKYFGIYLIVLAVLIFVDYMFTNIFF